MSFNETMQKMHEQAVQQMLLKAELERQTAEEHLRGIQCMNTELLKKAKINRIEAEENLAEYRLKRELDKECRRPSSVNWVEVSFDSDKSQWAACRGGVTAYGDTPAMACDNFDHLWVYGK